MIHDTYKFIICVFVLNYLYKDIDQDINATELKLHFKK